MTDYENGAPVRYVTWDEFEMLAVERNLWCYWGPPWIPCEASHPDAQPDLNRAILAVYAEEGVIVHHESQG